MKLLKVKFDTKEINVCVNKYTIVQKKTTTATTKNITLKNYSHNIKLYDFFNINITYFILIFNNKYFVIVLKVD